MAGISPKLPLTKNKQDGFSTNKSIEEVVFQNLKMILLTSPGERVGYSDFGVGLKNFLFEPLTHSLISSISSKINQQIKKYLPGLSGVNIYIDSALTNPDLAQNSDNVLLLSIGYVISSTGQKKELSLSLTESETVVDSSTPVRLNGSAY